MPALRHCRFIGQDEPNLRVKRIDEGGIDGEAFNTLLSSTQPVMAAVAKEDLETAGVS